MASNDVNTNPPLDDNNAWADFRRYKQGTNTIPAISVNKIPLVKWKDDPLGNWQTEPIPEWLHNKWKSENLFKNGYAIIVGKLWHGDYKDSGLYLIAIDFDKPEGIEKWFSSWEQVIESAKKTRIEWHQNHTKLHYLLYVKRPLQNRNLSHLGIELRAENELLYCGSHKDGNYWTPLGTDKITVLDESQLQNLEKIIDSLSGGKTSSLSTHRERNDPNYIKSEGENRSLDLLQEMDSLLINNYGILDDETIKQSAQNWYDKHCKPPYSNDKFESNWKQALEFRDKKIQDRIELDENFASTTIADDDKKKLKDEALFEVTRAYHFATFKETDEILYYKDGVYLHGGEVLIRETLEKLYGARVSIHLCREILDHIRRATYHERTAFDADLDIINMKNGLYYVQEDKLESHDPKHLSLNQKPFPHDASAIPKRFGKFLSEVVYFSDIDTVIELMGYTFYRDNPFEIITICHGFGGNGKSVLFGVLTALHGNHNVSHVSLKTILERPFGLYELVDKDVNLDAELSSGMIKDTALLKKITGRERCYVEQKNQKGFYAVIHAKPWFSCNLIPTIYNASNADFRRIHVISFPETFEEDRQDPNLIHTLTTESELSGIFNILMAALRRVLKNKKVSVSQKTIDERRIKYEMASNPVKTFTELAFEQSSLEASDYATKNDVYRAYVMFCTDNKLALISKESLGRKLKSLEFRWEDGQRAIFGGKEWCWIGHKLTVEYDRKIGNTAQETLSK